MSAHLTYMERRLLALRDSQLHRCWWCGEWRHGDLYCTTCTAPAVRPHDFNNHTNDDRDIA